MSSTLFRTRPHLLHLTWVLNFLFFSFSGCCLIHICNYVLICFIVFEMLERIRNVAVLGSGSLLYAVHLSLSLSWRWASCWCCKVFHWCECVQKGRLLFHKLIPVALVKFKSWGVQTARPSCWRQGSSAQRPEEYQTNSFIAISKITTKVRALKLFLVHFLLGRLGCVGALFKHTYHFLDALQWNRNAELWQNESGATNEGNLIFWLKEVGEEPQFRFNVLTAGMRPKLPLLHQTNIPLCFGLENAIVTLFA